MERSLHPFPQAENVHGSVLEDKSLAVLALSSQMFLAVLHLSICELNKESEMLKAEATILHCFLIPSLKK